MLPGVQDEWAAYVETIFRHITGSTHLVEWWESRPSSALKDYVLFLITTVMGTSSVERFFFICQAGTPQSLPSINHFHIKWLLWKFLCMLLRGDLCTVPCFRTALTFPTFPTLLLFGLIA